MTKVSSQIEIKSLKRSIKNDQLRLKSLREDHHFSGSVCLQEQARWLRKQVAGKRARLSTLRDVR